MPLPTPTPCFAERQHARQDARLEALRRKIGRYVDARSAAEAAFDKFKASPDWAEICERHGLAPDSDLGDWTC